MSKALITKIVQYLLFLGLGLLFAWLSFKNMNAENWAQLKKSVQGAQLWIGIPVFFMLIGSHLIRALRWRLLIEPLGYSPTKTNSFLAVMVGYLVNLGIPRLGEIVKCTLLARYEKIPADKLIGTIILERLIDALCLLIVFAVTLAVQPGLYSSITDTFFPEQTASKNDISPTLVLVFMALIVVIAIWMRFKKRTLADVVKQILQIAHRITDGISAIKRLKKRKQFFTLTIILWSLYLFAGYLGFLAFSSTSSYGIKEALTILSAGSIGMIASPGGIGAYAYLVQESMLLYGLDYTAALAFGWLLWLAQTAVIVLGGFLSFLALPWYNESKKPQ